MSNAVTLPTSTPNLVVERGKRAYQRIKQDAATMRENWRAVGEALLVGRGMYKSTKAFGAWCKEHFPELHKQVRADAMWLAENWAEVNQVDLTICHPMHIRQAFNEAQAKALVSPEDDIEVTPSITLDERSAEKVIKLARRAEAGDEGSEIAKRHVEALAKKHGTDVPTLKKAATQAAPLLALNLTPLQIEAAEEMIFNLKEWAQDYLNDSWDKEKLKVLLHYAVDSI